MIKILVKEVCASVIKLICQGIIIISYLLIKVLNGLDDKIKQGNAYFYMLILGITVAYL